MFVHLCVRACTCMLTYVCETSIFAFVLGSMFLNFLRTADQVLDYYYYYYYYYIMSLIQVLLLMASATSVRSLSRVVYEQTCTCHAGSGIRRARPITVWAKRWVFRTVRRSTSGATDKPLHATPEIFRCDVMVYKLFSQLCMRALSCLYNRLVIPHIIWKLKTRRGEVKCMVEGGENIISRHVTFVLQLANQPPPRLIHISHYYMPYYRIHATDQSLLI